MFNSTTDIVSLSQENPKPCNPSWDQVSNATDHFNNLLYSNIAEYLMSNEDEGSEENILLGNNNLSNNMTNCFDGSSSSSPPLACNIKSSRRELKKYKSEEELRFAFKTKTDLEFMDDGYKWRKYGKKMVKNNPNPRNYFKCSSGGCNVKKRVERDREDPSYVITTYQGMHNHESPNCVIYCSPQPPSLLHTSSSI